MFRNQGPDYYGDTDEMDSNLAAEEDQAQREGAAIMMIQMLTLTDWAKAARAAAETLSVADDTTIPAYPIRNDVQASGEQGDAVKRKSPEPEGEADLEPKEKKGRGAKKGKKSKASEASTTSRQPTQAAQAAQAALAARFMSVFDPASLAPPVLPTKDEMGKILLERRKDALRAEYGV